MGLHRVVKLRTNDKILLFFTNVLGCICCCRWKNKEKLQKLYEDGDSRIEASLDIIKIIKHMRYLTVLMKHSVMNKDAQKLLLHARNGILDLDEDLPVNIGQDEMTTIGNEKVILGI